MKKIKKNLLAVMAAVSLVGTSLSPVGTFNVQAEEVSAPKDLDDMILNLDVNSFKYTGEKISNLPIFIWYDDEEDSNIKYLNVGTDYKILAYAVPDGDFFDEFPTPLDTEAWIEGAPKEIGEYAILIEGMGNYCGKAVIPVSIIDPYDLKNIWAECSDENDIITYKDIYFYLRYFDPEINDSVYAELKEDKDFVFEGWCKQEDYVEGNRAWSKDKITEKDLYAFKFSGTGQYKGEQVAFFYVPDLNSIDSYLGYFSQAIKYDPNTKKYDFCLINDYLEEGKDYTLSYVDGEEFWSEDYDPEKLNWIEGLPNENSKPAKYGTYTIRIEAKAPYTGVTYYSGMSSRINLPNRPSLKSFKTY